MQGLGALLAGLGAEVLPPSTVVALCGAVGLLAVAGPLVAFRRTRGHAVGDEPPTAGADGYPEGAAGGGPGDRGARVPPAGGTEGRSGA